MIHDSQKNNADNILTVGALSVSAINNKGYEVLRKIDDCQKKNNIYIFKISVSYQ